MKLLFVGRYNDNEILTGPEKSAKRIFAEQAKRSESYFVQYFFDGNRHPLIKKLFGYEEKIIHGKSKIITAGLIRFIFLLLKLKPEFIHLITYERFYVTVFFYRLFRKVKIIYNVHGVIVYEQSLQSNKGFLYGLKNRICENIYFNQSDCLIFLSKLSLKFAKKYYKIKESKVKFIPNGIDIKFHEAFSGKKFNNDKHLKLVFCGDISRKEKGLDFLLEALKDLKFNAVLYVISGHFDISKYYSDKLEIFISQKMETEKLAEFYKDKDIFISASSYEQFSIAAAEAMSAGLIPVLTSSTGLSELIHDGENGWIFNYGDKKSLIRILDELNNDRNIMYRASENASKIYDTLSWDKVFLNYQNLYE